jgi:hypothetical protein
MVYYRGEMETMRTHQQIEERSLAMMRAIVEKIERDPERSGIEKARSVCARWKRTHTNPYLDRWESILQTDWDAIKTVLLDNSDQAAALRQNNPFCGILTPRERWEIYRRHRTE